MKRALISLTALSAIVLTSGVALARDVYSTAPDDDELGSVMTSQSDLASLPYNSQASIHQPVNQNIIKDDPATKPD